MKSEVMSRAAERYFDWYLEGKRDTPQPKGKAKAKAKGKKGGSNGKGKGAAR